MNFARKIQNFRGKFKHDSTLYAFLSVLGVIDDVLAYGNPQYSAATLVELYIKDDTQEPFVKVR